MKVMKRGNKEGKRRKETDREMEGRTMQRHRDGGGSIVRGNTERRRFAWLRETEEAGKKCAEKANRSR